MPITASKKGGTFDPVPEDIHKAICYGVVDLGTQENPLFNSHDHKILIIWELPEQRIEIEGEDKPRAISREYTLSLHEKSHLRHHLESWRGKKFTDDELEGWDVQKILGVPANLQVMHEKSKKSGNLYAKIENVLPYKGQDRKKLEPENEFLTFSFEDGNTVLPENIPEWIEKKIQSSLEWGAYNRSEEVPKSEEYEEETYEEIDGPPF